MAIILITMMAVLMIDDLTRFPAFVFDNTKDKNESVLDNKATVQVVRR